MNVILLVYPSFPPNTNRTTLALASSYVASTENTSVSNAFLALINLVIKSISILASIVYSGSFTVGAFGIIVVSARTYSKLYSLSAISNFVGILCSLTVSKVIN